MGFRKALLFVGFLNLAFTAYSQTPTLQAVTDQGSTTTNSIFLWNKDGLCVGVDASTNYTVKSHYIRPSSAEPRTMRFDCNANTTTGGWEFYNTYLTRAVMVIKQNTGNVGIGTTDPKAKLSVNGDIYAKRVRVTPDGWADFVFEPSYQLLSLAELDRYIQEHKHLPDMPTAKEVATDGVDLGANQVKLLQKIEEMTLYLIEQHKKLMEQKDILSKQTEMLENQEQRMSALEKKLGIN
jgi:hypothetical protein